MKKQQGFTLVELTVSLLILGIMAAVAMPKFADLAREARIVKLRDARASAFVAAEEINSAIQLRGGVADAAACPGVTPAVTANNTTTVCTKYGIVNIINRYPQALLPPAAGGIVSAAGLNAVFSPTLAQLNSGGYSATGGGTAITSVLTIQVTGGSNPANCSFTYQPAINGALGAAAAVSAPIITGC